MILRKPFVAFQFLIPLFALSCRECALLLAYAKLNAATRWTTPASEVQSRGPKVVVHPQLRILLRPSSKLVHTMLKTAPATSTYCSTVSNPIAYLECFGMWMRSRVPRASFPCPSVHELGHYTQLILLARLMVRPMRLGNSVLANGLKAAPSQRYSVQLLTVMLAWGLTRQLQKWSSLVRPMACCPGYIFHVHSRSTGAVWLPVKKAGLIR